MLNHYHCSNFNQPLKLGQKMVDNTPHYTCTIPATPPRWNQWGWRGWCWGWCYGWRWRECGKWGWRGRRSPCRTWAGPVPVFTKNMKYENQIRISTNTFQFLHGFSGGRSKTSCWRSKPHSSYSHTSCKSQERGTRRGTCFNLPVFKTLMNSSCPRSFNSDKKILLWMHSNSHRSDSNWDAKAIQ